MSTPLDDSQGQRRLIALTCALFLSYLAVAMSLPVVPVYVAHQLGLSNALGGLAVGIAFLSTIVTRNYAGNLSDRLGGKLCMLRGLKIYTCACLICLVFAWPGWHSTVAYGGLLGGRLLLGIGESLVVVGMIGWGIGLMGPARSGKVLALVGIGMYGAFAVGGPVGLLIFHEVGFGSLMAVCAVLPMVGLWMVREMPNVPTQSGQRESFVSILGRIWRPGMAVCLQGVGFAGLGAFISLYFSSRGWPYAGLGLTCFGVGFVLMRVLAGHLPDRIGGTPVAVASLAVEACGQYLLWLAPGPWAALLGALLTGLGCSMVFPGLGAEIVKRVPPHLRGAAVGGFAAFQDLAYGLTGPLTGLLADHAGYAVIFLVGGVCATVALCLAIWAHRVMVPRATA